MADASDDPHDVVRYYWQLEAGYDWAFGSRFLRQSRVVDYPRHKLLLNRLANTFIRVLFGLAYNDVTNAFKAYRREVIDGIQPILACHFNLTVELPLKAIIRGYFDGVVPINWPTAPPASPSSESRRWAAATSLSCSTCCWRNYSPEGTTSAATQHA
jgi:dolichol-phosphate mannosyltransferase